MSGQGGGVSGPGPGQRGAPPLGQYGILHVIGGNDRGKQCELSLTMTQIGRGADQDLVLADIAVSRRHIQIFQTPTGYRLKDLGSGNGTLINGKRVNEVPLGDGDQIELGNTLLRFEHPPSRQAGEPPPPAYAAPPPPAYAPPQAYAAPPAYAPPPAYPPPGYGQPSGMPPMAMPMNPPPATGQPYGSAAVPAMAMPPPGYAPQPMMAAPYGSAAMPVGMAMPMQAPVQGADAALRPGFLSTPRSRTIAFPALGGALLVGLLLLFVQQGRAAPQGDPAEVLRHYNAGAVHFNARKFDSARKEFQQALELAPESAELKARIRACDKEAESLGYINAAKGAINNRRYGEALQAFDKVTQESVQYDEAQRTSLEVRQQVTSTNLSEAKNLALSDPAAAMAKIKEGLRYDPNHHGLLALQAEVERGTTVQRLPKDEPQERAERPERTSMPSRPTPLRSKRTPKVAKVGKAPVADRKVARPTVSAEPVPPGADLLTNKGALIAYRSRDFNAAINAMQNFAKINKGAAQQKALSVVKELEEMKGLNDKGQKNEGSNPAAALSAYNSALSLDRRMAGGTLASYFQGKVTVLQGRTGSKPAGGGPRDAAKDAQADQLLSQAQGLMKKDPTRARVLCRKALSLYGNNAGDPKAQAILKVLNSIPKDEDE